LRHAGNLYGNLEALSLASVGRQEKDVFSRTVVQLAALRTFTFNFHKSTSQSTNAPKRRSGFFRTPETPGLGGLTVKNSACHSSAVMCNRIDAT
jgi:hypothetical protein